MLGGYVNAREYFLGIVCVWWHGYESGVIDDFEKLRCETGQQHNLFIIKVAVFPEKE